MICVPTRCPILTKALFNIITSLDTSLKIFYFYNIYITILHNARYFWIFLICIYVHIYIFFFTKTLFSICVPTCFSFLTKALFNIPTCLNVSLKIFYFYTIKHYVHRTNEQRKTTQEATIQVPASLTAPRVVINYIHRGLVDDRFSSKRQKQRLLPTTSIRERVNFVQCNFLEGSMSPIDDTITFTPLDTNRVLRPHEDALILTLGIDRFDVKRVLVNSGSSTDLMQMSTYK